MAIDMPQMANGISTNYATPQLHTYGFKCTALSLFPMLHLPYLPLGMIWEGFF